MGFIYIYIKIYVGVSNGRENGNYKDYGGYMGIILYRDYIEIIRYVWGLFW